MKINGYQVVSECVDGEILKRPISNLSADTMKDSVEISKESSPKIKPDPDPKKLPLEKEKGKAMGDEKGKVEKELNKIEKK